MCFKDLVAERNQIDTLDRNRYEEIKRSVQQELSALGIDYLSLEDELESVLEGNSDFRALIKKAFYFYTERAIREGNRKIIEDLFLSDYEISEEAVAGYFRALDEDHIKFITSVVNCDYRITKIIA